MKATLSGAGLQDIERFSAIDARAGIDTLRYSPRSWGAYWTMTETEIAVFESHRAVWSRLLSQGLSVAAIFEDDILASPGLGTAITDLSREAHLFDVVKLDGAPGVVRLGPEEALGPQPVREIRQVLPSAAAYLLSADGAEKLLDSSATYCDHLDDFVMRPRSGWRAFQLMPARAVQGMFCAAEAVADLSGTLGFSERTSEKTANEGYDKGPAPYRIAKELRRSARKAARALWADQALIGQGGHLGEVPLAPGLGPYRAG